MEGLQLNRAFVLFANPKVRRRSSSVTALAAGEPQQTLLAAGRARPSAA
jgi:hypothetical protein